MLRRLGHLLLSATMLWFALANPGRGVPGHVPPAAPVFAASIDAPADESRIESGTSELTASRWSVSGPALPASLVAAPELHTATVAARDVARTVVPTSAASLHARRARQLASISATVIVHRLDALWRADTQRLLAIPQYATAPPLIG